MSDYVDSHWLLPVAGDQFSEFCDFQGACDDAVHHDGLIFEKTPAEASMAVVAAGPAPWESSFQSGYRPVMGQQMTKRPKKVDDPSGFKRDYPGCRSRSTFKRKYELARHQKIHQASFRKVECPAVDCGLTFPHHRLDKMKEHLERAHDADDLCKCRVESCKVILPLDLLKLHAHRSIMKEYRDHKYLRALPDAENARVSCPVSDCKAREIYAKLREHLRLHSQKDRVIHEAGLRELAFDAAPLQPICPVCGDSCEDNQRLSVHIEIYHLSSDSRHYRAYLDYVTQFKRPNEALRIWVRWSPGGQLQWDSPASFVCPGCGVEVGRSERVWADSESCWYDHHLQLLRDPEELRPYRREILRVFPAFEFHPAFAGIKAVIQ